MKNAKIQLSVLVEAVGLARARGYEAQVRALGQGSTALVNAVNALADGHIRFVPDVLVTSGNGPGALDGLAASLMRFLDVRPSQPAAEATKAGQA